MTDVFSAGACVTSSIEKQSTRRFGREGINWCRFCGGYASGARLMGVAREPLGGDSPTRLDLALSFCKICRVLLYMPCVWYRSQKNHFVSSNGRTYLSGTDAGDGVKSCSLAGEGSGEQVVCSVRVHESGERSLRNSSENGKTGRKWKYIQKMNKIGSFMYIQRENKRRKMLPSDENMSAQEEQKRRCVHHWWQPDFGWG